MPRLFAPPALVAAVMLVLVLAIGCRASAVPPLTWSRHPDEADGKASHTLVLMFPGVGDDGDAYVDQGFVERLQAARKGVDVVTVDARRQYFAARTLLARVDKDVLRPARQRGYTRIWIVGLSMGGVGALLTARHFGNDVDGLVLFAPYLGRHRIIARIGRAGGVRKWKPPVGKTTWSVDLWRWIRGYGEGKRRPIIYLASGTEDMWAKAHKLIGEIIPPEHIFSGPGGHAWTVWSPLWTKLLDAGVINTPAD